MSFLRPFDPVEVQVPNFVGILQAAQQYRANQYAMNARQQEADRLNQARMLTGQYLQAPADSIERQQAAAQLQQVAPEEFLGLQQQLAGKETTGLQQQLLRKQLQPAAPKFQLSDVAAPIAERFGYGKYDPAALQDERVRLAIQQDLASRQKGRTTPQAQVAVNVGNQQPLEKPLRSKYQEKLIDTQQSISALEQIKNYDPNQFLTYAAQGLTGVAKIADKFGISPASAKGRIAQSTKFKNLVNTEFNKYRVAVTGAAGSVQELNRLKDAFINTDQSPAEFAASRDLYLQELNRSRRLYSTLLSKGINLRDKEGGQALDELFLSGADGKSPEDVAYRDAQLERSGIADARKRHDILIKEGYFE